MAQKYIIGSNIKFVRGRGELVNNAPSATHYKSIEADKFINMRRDLCKYRVRSSSNTNKDFVIGQIMYAVGNDNNVVVSVEAAKQFCSRSDAEYFIKENVDLINKIEFPYIYDGSFNKIKDITELLKEYPKELEMPLEVDSDNDSNICPTKRISISRTERIRIYNKSNKTCAICGKPLKIDEFSIDHIKPLALGGTYDDNNLQVVHKECNAMKADLEESDFYSLVNVVAENQLINHYNYNNMLSIARAAVRGTIASFGGIL